jgi:hypothetical protein
MIDITGIELGPDCCVLVRAGSDPSRTTVTAARAVTPGEWSGDHDAIVGLLRSAKRSNRLSSHARVVAWGLPESGAPADLTHLPELGPLVAAGFEIDSIVSPVRALADLVRSRREEANGEGIAALSLNSHGAAIAIVSRGQVVASRVFEWPLGRPFSGAYSEELDRYLLVSQIASELRHLIQLVRPVHGVTVTSVVACGNLPNLRSLSMLLIEEMDLEVETLDSVELLDPQGAGRLADLVPTLQLAALAAMPRDDEHSADSGGDASGGPESRSARSLDKHSSPYGADRPRSGSALVQLVATAAMVLLTTWSVFAVSGSSPATPVFPTGLEVASAQVPAVPELATEGTIGRVEGPGSRDAVRGAERAVDSSQGVAAHPAVSTEPPQSRAAPREPRPAALLPTISGVMIAGDHRIAIVGDRIVSVGDYVGPYKIASIDRDQVVLIGPAGQSVQVAIRIRKPPPPGYP